MKVARFVCRYHDHDISTQQQTLRMTVNRKYEGYKNTTEVTVRASQIVLCGVFNIATIHDGHGIVFNSFTGP